MVQSLLGTLERQYSKYSNTWGSKKSALISPKPCCILQKIRLDKPLFAEVFFCEGNQLRVYPFDEGSRSFVF